MWGRRVTLPPPADDGKLKRLVGKHPATGYEQQPERRRRVGAPGAEAVTRAGGIHSRSLRGVKKQIAICCDAADCRDYIRRLVSQL